MIVKFAVLARLAPLCLVLLLLSRGSAVKGQGKLQMEIVSFGPHGFTPAVISRQAGPFILSIHNTARFPSLEFSLEDGAGQVVMGGIKLGDRISNRYQKAVNLQSGAYTLRIKELPSQTMIVRIS